MEKVILIVAAHSDDEVLGCGGTIARHVAEGDTVYAIFLADGVTSRSDSSKSELEHRNSAAEKARKILGITKNYYIGLPDNRLDSLPLIEIIQHFEPIIQKLKPEIIYTHHHGDLNVDHRITHQAVMTVCRPVPGCSVREIHTFEVMSSTEWSTLTQFPFVPNYHIAITKYLDIKLEALRAYDIEMRKTPHSRSYEHIEYLARHRGSCIGMAAAEAFFTVRRLR